MIHWLAHWLGLDDPSGGPYAWWSGVGSDISEVAILGAVIGAYRKHTCHVSGCWRLGHRQVPGTAHTVCRAHHPHPEPTHEQVLAEHAASKETT